MLILCMDTSHKHMGIALLNEEGIIDQTVKDCFKKQSETLLPEVDALLKKNGFVPKDITEICISKGPGSYTGVRIAMTVAKTLGALASIPVDTVSTLRLYSAGKDGLVLLDARSHRGYTGIFGEENFEGILDLDEIQKKAEGKEVFGDGSLIGRENRYLPIGECFDSTRGEWQRVENIHTLVPEYFKGNEGYKTIQ